MNLKREAVIFGSQSAAKLNATTNAKSEEEQKCDFNFRFLKKVTAKLLLLTLEEFFNAEDCSFGQPKSGPKLLFLTFLSFALPANAKEVAKCFARK